MEITLITAAPRVGGSTVRIALGDRETSGEWLEGQVEVTTSARSTFVAVQLDALQRLRSALDAEVTRLRSMQDRSA